ncbi:MAG: tRNA (guanosine(46)-N7)-methyltransferase TrmB [Firmicutes bacterium]|mgnify:FL=1|jgi:tRNA (guanine-N7-)-methyltransferase|nr:tRNA (guanosine(46)-N7)-methyltransferase TrmB [Bacillota bacterium]
MRQRNIKNLSERIEQNSRLLIEEPGDCKGRWAEIFGNGNPIYLEIGCGKGNFITKHAFAEPDCNFIACEGQMSVVLRALEKAEASGSGNLRVFIDFVNDLEDYFEVGELSGIYLNFSDPWPKARHAKRRLTYRGRLQNYKKVLKPDGFIEFKTDNEGLFAFTLEEIEACGYEMIEMSRDLHGEAQGVHGEKSRCFMTEYEEKFSGQGKNINFVRF